VADNERYINSLPAHFQHILRWKFKLNGVVKTITKNVVAWHRIAEILESIDPKAPMCFAKGVKSDIDPEKSNFWIDPPEVEESEQKPPKIRKVNVIRSEKPANMSDEDMKWLQTEFEEEAKLDWVSKEVSKEEVEENLRKGGHLAYAFVVHQKNDKKLMVIDSRIKNNLVQLQLIYSKFIFRQIT